MFRIGTILSMVDFVGNTPFNKKMRFKSNINPEKVNIMVHITYKHEIYSAEDNKAILKEYHFYISDDSSIT